MLPQAIAFPPYSDALPPALSGLSRLRLCYLGPAAEPGTGAPPLPDGPWLRSLQWLSVDPDVLLSSTAALQAAAALECVSISGSLLAEAVDWSSPAADAFFGWLAQHPPLRRLSVDVYYPKQSRNWRRLSAHIRRLGRHRPGLLVQRPGLRDEGESLQEHLQEAYPF